MYVPHYRWPIALLDIHLTCGISFLLRSVNLILFTLLLINLILNTSLHHIHQLRSHHLSPLGFSLQCWNSSPIYVIFRFLDCLHGSWTCIIVSSHWFVFVLVCSFCWFLFLVSLPVQNFADHFQLFGPRIVLHDFVVVTAICYTVTQLCAFCSCFCLRFLNFTFSWRTAFTGFNEIIGHMWHRVAICCDYRTDVQIIK